MSIKSRVAKLETKNGLPSKLWIVHVLLKDNETKEKGFSRTLKENEIDKSMVGYVHYMGVNVSWPPDEYLNNYEGDVGDLRGFDIIRKVMDEIAKDPDVGPGPSKSRRKMIEAKQKSNAAQQPQEEI